MDRVLIIIILLLIYTSGYSQIPDYSNVEPELIPEPFKGDKVNLNYREINEVLAGTIGEKVFLNEDQCIVKEFNTRKSDMDEGSLILDCQNGITKKVSQYDIESLFFIKGISTIKENVIGKTYYHNNEEQSLHDLEGKAISVIKHDKFVISDVYYCKLNPSEYGICSKMTNGNVFQLELDKGEIPRTSILRLGAMDSKGFVIHTSLMDEEEAAMVNPYLPSLDNVIGDLNDIPLSEGEFDSQEYGESDKSKGGIFGRKVIYRDPAMVRLSNGNVYGKIVFNVCINRKGVVTYVEIDEMETTFNDLKLLKNAMTSMSKYKYEPDTTAAKEQCGNYIVNIDSFKNYGN